ARLRRLASERESQIRPTPNATVRTRAASGQPGGSTPCTISTRFAISGVRAETRPIAPTPAAAHASTFSALGTRSSTLPRYNVPMRESGETSVAPAEAEDVVRIPLPGWMTLLLGLVAVALVPWILYLTFTLPSRHVTLHYDLAWIGFDVALLASFAATAWATF